VLIYICSDLGTNRLCLLAISSCPVSSSKIVWGNIILCSEGKTHFFCSPRRYFVVYTRRGRNTCIVPTNRRVETMMAVPKISVWNLSFSPSEYYINIIIWYYSSKCVFFLFFPQHWYIIMYITVSTVLSAEFSLWKILPIRVHVYNISNKPAYGIISYNINVSYYRAVNYCLSYLII